MDALVHMLVHLWTRPPHNPSSAWIAQILPSLPGLLIVVLALPLFWYKTPPGRPRNTAALGLLALIAASSLMLALNVLMARSAHAIDWLLQHALFIFRGRLVLELAAYALLFWVLLRARQRTAGAPARASSVAAWVLLPGAEVLRMVPVLLPPCFGHSLHDFLRHHLLWRMIPALLWLAGFVLLLRALIAVLRHSDTMRTL